MLALTPTEMPTARDIAMWTLEMRRDTAGMRWCRDHGIGWWRASFNTDVPAALFEAAAASAIDLGQSCKRCRLKKACPFGGVPVTGMLPVQRAALPA
jgi:hypothetical protein